ncbi:helix-turn-helix domain-containing protein [Saccharothrix sp. S26]|uniref:helix-turn-helix domain-containing protein n=1 Tax=Saccharothrix sp. S26 TaxID=2907215 RepID=UPI001F1D8591|nr:helix-turn-helix transcriptional regulator [Saccharothrix sp. S26]MCE6993778.1 helix-turn-helix domain-containing protein [Saccharothrix sp. S26]
MTQGNTGPGVRRRLLAKALIQLREQAGKSFDDVVEALAFSKSKISRIEAGGTGVSIVDARALGQLYGADADTLAWLERLARIAKQRGRWHVFGDGLVDWFSDFVVLESEASMINTFEIDLVPGLFQTEEYAAMVLRAYSPDVPDDVVQRKVALRQTRQNRVTDGSLSVWAIVDEAALRRTTGDPVVDRRQLERLLAMSLLTNVVLQVLPFDKGLHMAMGTAFSLLRFHGYPSIVYVDNLTGGVYLDEEADLERYSLVLDHLRATALNVRESAEFIKGVIADL